MHYVTYRLQDGSVKRAQTRVPGWLAQAYIIWGGASSCFFSKNHHYIVCGNKVHTWFGPCNTDTSVCKIVRFGHNKRFTLAGAMTFVKDVAVAQDVLYMLRRDGSLLRRHGSIIDTNVLFVRSTYHTDHLCYIRGLD